MPVTRPFLEQTKSKSDRGSLSYQYCNNLNPLTPGSETQETLVCLMPDDFTCQLGVP